MPTDRYLKPKQELHSLLILPAVAFVLWLVLTDIAEYLLTHHWYFLNRIDTTHSSLALISILFFCALLPVKRVSSLRLALLFIVLSSTMIGHQYYKSIYHRLQKFPKVKSISKDWTIQADRIVITGRNFGTTWDPGQVVVGDEVFTIISWSDNRVVVEQPVPKHYFEAPMVLTNHLGNEVTLVQQFRLRDPGEILQSN